MSLSAAQQENASISLSAKVEFPEADPCSCCRMATGYTLSRSGTIRPPRMRGAPVAFEGCAIIPETDIFATTARSRQGPGPHDVIAFEKAESDVGVAGGLSHFGFGLIDPSDIAVPVGEVQRAGARLLRQGEFAPGFSFAYVADPEGYEIEIWYE